MSEDAQVVKAYSPMADEVRIELAPDVAADVERWRVADRRIRTALSEEWDAPLRRNQVKGNRMAWHGETYHLRYFPQNGRSWPEGWARLGLKGLNARVADLGDDPLLAVELATVPMVVLVAVKYRVRQFHVDHLAAYLKQHSEEVGVQAVTATSFGPYAGQVYNLFVPDRKGEIKGETELRAFEKLLRTALSLKV